MDVGNTQNLKRKIKFRLVFFCVCCLASCGQQPSLASPEIHYEDGKAVAVVFRADEHQGPYRIFLAGERNTAVLGISENRGPLYTFRPAIPFTPGLRYTIRSSTDSLSGFEVANSGDEAIAPKITAIYPLNDSIPENLLKCYLLFSQPMQAVGNATDYIEVSELQSGEEVAIFLELESELWNREHTRLTLWLDPGRIKTDLIPNLTRGKPLLQGKSYTIRVLKEWRSAQGIPLQKDYHKTIHVLPADIEKPDPEYWKLELPEAGSRQPLIVRFMQPVDLLTALDGSQVSGESGQNISGTWDALSTNKAMAFVPENSWETGSYSVQIDTSLEDLAGNTVNRLFDTDLEVAAEKSPLLKEIVLPFAINY